MLKILFSVQTAIWVFEKPTTIRRPLLYATNMRDGRTRRDVASAPSPMKPYNPLFIWSLEKHPSFSLHCYTNPCTNSGRFLGNEERHLRLKKLEILIQQAVAVVADYDVVGQDDDL